jgi:hypothetical protein
VFIFDTQTGFTTNGGNLTLIANSTAADGVVDAQRLAGAGNIIIGDNTQFADVQTGGGTLTMEIRNGAGINNAQTGSVIFDGMSSTNTEGGNLVVIAPGAAIGNDLAAGTASVTTGTASFSGELKLYQGTFTSAGNVTVAGLTTWIPFDNSSAAQDFTLNGSGQLFANGGFDISSNLNNDTLTLDKVVSIGGLSSWGDASFATSIIAGTGSFINNGDIDVFNTVQLTVGVDIVNNAEISKNSGVGVLELSGNLTMNPGSKLTVFEGSTVSLSGGAGTLLLTNTAGFGGGGTLNGNVNSTGGVIDIENSSGTPGTLTINGALTLDSISTLLFDLGGTVQGVSHDFLNVTGNVNLDGTLAL